MGIPGTLRTRWGADGAGGMGTDDVPRLAGARKQVARVGVGVMLAGIALFSGVYFIAGLGNYAIPTWFPFGPGGVNGMAMDDAMTGLVGIGTLILAAAILPEVRQSFSRLGSTVAKRFNPVRASVHPTYVMATAAMFLCGFYIEMDESRFGSAALPASRAIDARSSRAATSCPPSAPCR